MGMIGKLMRWTLRIGAAAALLLLLLLAAGGIYQAVATAREQSAFPPLGRLVDAGGHRLHLYCTGEGSPAVVLEAGIGMASPAWSKVQPLLQNLTQVCSYDRAGMGWSEPGPLPRDGVHMVRELHTLLSNSGMSAPYVLAGHSFGGRLVRLYAAAYPKLVAGLVLVDTPPDDLFEKLETGFPQEFPDQDESLVKTVNLLRVGAWFGIHRLLGLTAGNLERFPEQMRDRARVIRLWRRALEANYGEVLSNRDTMRQLRNSDWNLGERPLAVISAGPPPSDAPLPEGAGLGEAWAYWWRRGQAGMALRSNDGRHIYAEKSGHNVQFDQPEVVAQAISWVVQRCRDAAANRNAAGVR